MLVRIVVAKRVSYLTAKMLQVAKWEALSEKRIMTKRLALLIFAAATRVTHAQESKSSPVGETALMHKEMGDFATNIKVHADVSPASAKARPVLQKTPIFRWTNPERKTDVGNVFLWTIDGRPHATLGIWPEGSKYGYEMQSFAPKPFLVEFANGEKWKQRTGALEFRKLADEKKPGKSATRRLIEMRKIVRTRFRGRVQDWDRKNPGQLRLLPNPLYRYGEVKPKNVVDGAIFAFALGTDPEMLVLLEARQDPKSAELAWYYALGSATLYFLDAYLDDKHVWTDRMKIRDRTYFMRY